MIEVYLTEAYFDTLKALVAWALGELIECPNDH
jgi:hypothetical protein